jgi:prepilin-type N-terminal cleavage/methylation domain-containing protein/prepilin-type processing-associated H-X9-DG protein
MSGLGFSPRLLVVVALLLGAVGFLYFAQTDHVPHDRSARVKSEVFWAAVARPDPTQRPTDIVVYPVRLGVQLVTCTRRLPGMPAMDRFFYQKVGPGQATVEARLASLGIAFSTPWWDSPMMKYGPWACVALAIALLVVPGLMGFVKEAAQAKPAQQTAEAKPQVGAADLQKVRELDEAMASALTPPGAEGEAQGAAAAPAGAPAAPKVLTGGPLEAMAPMPQEKKDYHGQFYPVAHPEKHEGFTIVELLVVIGIIGVLITLLLPTLMSARGDAKQITCEANLRSIGQALVAYETENDGLIPASYSYHGQTVVNGAQVFTGVGYVHWSYFLYGHGAAGANAFLCPELDGGGLPPTNTTAANQLPGQVADTPGALDDQAPRVAYTLNEAVSPRNKFVLGFQGAVRVYRLVHASSVANWSGTILATEWAATGARFAGPVLTGGFYIFSHRPVHGFVGLDGTLDMYELKPGVGYRRVTAADLDPDPSSASDSGTRLDWVGRNHGHVGGYPDQGRTNFLYMDGHTECKTIYQTLSPFQWGEKFYTLDPNDDLQP